MTRINFGELRITFSTLAFCIYKHIVGGIVFYKPISSSVIKVLIFSHFSNSYGVVLIRSTLLSHFYEGHAKSSVTNRLPLFYPRYILKCFTALEWCVE